MNSYADVVLYAPNVHTGGGLVLLQALLVAWPVGVPLRALLDDRARRHLNLPASGEWHWVKPTAGSRLKAESTLRRLSQASDTILCFHGLPPLLPNLGRVVVFQQNRLYLGLTPVSRFFIRTAVRLAMERLVSRLFRRRVSEYIVQTPTMARDLAKWYMKGSCSDTPVVRVLPFMDALPQRSGTQTTATEWDFVYVADGEAHKNHHRLLAAWRELAKEGIKPRLALTLSTRDKALMQVVDVLRAECGAQVYDLGQMPHDQVIVLYTRSRALIFPSLAESFGLPLIEAQQLGLPIIASELDYVRDVCLPVQTFDPYSPKSIARAVKRFLCEPDPNINLLSARDFWQVLLEPNQQQQALT